VGTVYSGSITRPIVVGVPMSLTSSDEEFMYSHSDHPSDTVNLGRQVMTMLISLSIVLLCGWLNGRF
jgi:hypothetical protein